MAPDDLSAPLGQKQRKTPRIVLPIAVPHVVAGALALFIAAFAGWSMLAQDPLGGEPLSVVPLYADAAGKPGSGPGNPSGVGANRYDGPRPGTGAQTQAEKPGAENQAVPTPGTQTITIIDGSSGRRQQVEIPATQDEPSGAPADQRLLDSSRHGSIPKIGADGVRPAEAYARPASRTPADANKPRIAIIVGGLGIGAKTTTDALAKLPGAITLAFSPYASDAARLAARARSDGHEVLLQVPMEPFDYPDNDPGPQALLTTLLPEQNLDRLHWLMSRLQGYVGVINVMGNRFTATERALSPVLNEIGRRGLIYVDDGSSPRSVASQVAGTSQIPFAKADVMLDAVTTPANVDRALTRLEALARERGVVIGIASATPAVIERIAQWAKAAEERGLLLVPITAAVGKPKAS